MLAWQYCEEGLHGKRSLITGLQRGDGLVPPGIRYLNCGPLIQVDKNFLHGQWKEWGALTERISAVPQEGAPGDGLRFAIGAGTSAVGKALRVPLFLHNFHG